MVSRMLRSTGRLLLLALHILFQLQLQGVLGQNLTCSSDEANAYIRCVQDNPCLCSRCDPDPLDEDPVILVESPPKDCQDINRLFCPFIRCCSACEDAARAWFGCTFQDFSYETLGQDCPNSCSGFPLLDVEGDCEPTPAPSTSPTPCESEIDEFNSCISDTATCDSSCAISSSDLNPSGDNSDGETCKAHDAIVCPLVDCCSDCSEQLGTFSQCIQEELKLGDGTGTECSLSCDAENASPPSPSPSISAAPAPPPTSSLPPPPTLMPVTTSSTTTSSGRYAGVSAFSGSLLGLCVLLSSLSFEL